MASSTLLSSSFLHSSRIFGPKATGFEQRMRGSYLRVSALKRDSHDYENKGFKYRGRLVDDNMIVLRMRIRDLEMVEGTDSKPRPNWTEWEKRYYRRDYNSDVCEAMGILQSMLLEARPGVVLGVVGVVAVSVTTLAALLVFQLVGFVMLGVGWFLG